MDNIIAAMESGHPHLTTQKAFYVAVSRAREGVELVINDAKRLVDHLEEVTGERVSALDAAERQVALGIQFGEERTDLPAVPENTWRFGLDRLMLGHAMVGNGSRTFDGILPCDDVEGPEVRLMGELDRFAEEIFDAAHDLGTPRTAAEWQDTLDGLLTRFFSGREAEEDIETIRAAVRRLVDESHRAGCADTLSLQLILRGLDRLLRQPGGAWAFLSGSVTFCTMVPMRNIPAQVVCLLGMNDESYPRSRRPPGFDLVPRHPQKGDRSRRDDDRYLFLEALLSARHTFYVSYVGRSIRDNTDIPPSILASELQDAIQTSCVGDDGVQMLDLVTTHPLQPFSPRYFAGDDRLFSYARELCEAAKASRNAARNRPTTAPAFLSSTLPTPDEEWRTVRLDALLRFYRDPTKYFLKNRLGVVLDDSESLIENSEPFELVQLNRYQVRDRLMDLALERHDEGKLRDLVRASGALPHGLVGERALESLQVEVGQVASRLLPLLPAERLPPETIDQEFGNLRLVGALSGLTHDGIVDHGFDNTRKPGSPRKATQPNGRDHLALWIRHLALNVMSPPGVALTSRRVSNLGILELKPIPNAAQRLSELLELYWDGLQRPMQLFPDKSIECLLGSRETVALSEIASPWNAYPNVAFRSRDPGDAEFLTLAHQVFGPLLDAAEFTK